MLIEKPMLGILNRTPYLSLLNFLWKKADCFSLTTPQDNPEDIPIRSNIIRTEDRTIFYELNPQTKTLFTILTGFLDFCQNSWCDLKFYQENRILFNVTTHEGGIEIDSQLYQEFFDFCKIEYEKNSEFEIKSLLLYEEMENADLSDSNFHWKRKDDGSSIQVVIEKAGQRYISEYRFPVKFSSDIPEEEKVKVTEIEFGSQAGVMIGNKNISVFTLSVITNPPKLFKYKTTETEETSFELQSLQVFMI